MRYTVFAIGKFSLLLTIVAIASAGCGKNDKPSAGTSVVDDKDPEMNAAIEKARGSLKHFWETKANPKQGERDFTLKVRFKDTHGGEHIWVSNLESKEGKIYGRVDNEPVTVRSVKNGQRVEIPEADISDWMYMRGDKMVGNYTVRALFKVMPKEDAEKIKKMIADP